MIERYTKPEMASVWDDAVKYQIWKSVEVAAAEAKGAPHHVLMELHGTPSPTPREVEEEEQTTRHDVVAFLNVWRRRMTPEAARWVHRGMTSSDLVDTANAVRLHLASELIADELGLLLRSAARHAVAHWDTPRLARTHGQPAEASTWGYWVAGFSVALQRADTRFIRARIASELAKLSGPVGNYRYATPLQEETFASILGLRPARIATQVVMRDGVADWVFALAQIATVIESFALEVRLGQHQGVDELAEGYADGQIGSSAMPHKRNPIASEQLCGLAKLVRAQVMPTLEGVALWHERDISHSSVERVTLETAASLTHYMLVTARKLIEDLHVSAAIMLAHLFNHDREVRSAAAKLMLVAEAGADPESVDRFLREHLYTMPLEELPEPPEPQLDHVYTWLVDLIKSPDATI